MAQKLTPRLANLPQMKGSVMFWAAQLVRELTQIFGRIRDDLDNGATTFPIITIAGIANVAVADFDEGQIRLYIDSSDSNKVYLVSRVSSATKKVELT